MTTSTMNSNLRPPSLQSNLNLSVWSSHCEVHLKLNFHRRFLCRCIFLNSLWLPRSFQSLGLHEVLSFLQVFGWPVLGVVFHHSFCSGLTCRESYLPIPTKLLHIRHEAVWYSPPQSVIKKTPSGKGLHKFWQCYFYRLCKPQLLRPFLIPAPVSLCLVKTLVRIRGHYCTFFHRLSCQNMVSGV